MLPGFEEGNQEYYPEYTETEPYKMFEPYEQVNGVSQLRYMYFIQFMPLLEQGMAMPDDFLEVIEHIQIEKPLTEEEYNENAK